MTIYAISLDSLVVPPDRQRKEFPGEAQVELAESIEKRGLLHPIVFKTNENGDRVLVAGERRLRALKLIWAKGNTVYCNGQPFAPQTVPATTVGDIDELTAKEIEFEENAARLDLTWQERAAATRHLHDLRRARDVSQGREPETVASFVRDVTATKVIDQHPAAVRRDVILADALHIPAVAKAKSADDAYKALRRHETLRSAERQAMLLGETFTANDHQLFIGDCLQVMQKLPSGAFDAIVSDPPYGMNAQDFDNGGGMQGGQHLYDDSPEQWRALMKGMFKEASRVCRPEAHMYLFCDIENFAELKNISILNGWHPFRTPFIWINSTSNRLPWLKNGPMRKWQMIFYAVRGDKPCTSVKPDVLAWPSDPNIGHTAQKPIAVYQDLISRSVTTGGAVLDPFCGSGPIFPAAHNLQVLATGIEIETYYAGMAADRIGKLK